MKKLLPLLISLFLVFQVNGQEKKEKKEKKEKGSTEEVGTTAELKQPPPDDGGGGGGTTYTWYKDMDRDGYGNPYSTYQSSTKPYGYVSNNKDCDDSDPNIRDECYTTPPATPSTVSVNKYCGYTKLTRGTPPSWVTWYWQSSSTGTSTSNSNVSINRYSGTVYYLRARDNRSFLWSSARSVSYTINQEITWYRDNDQDFYGDSAVSVLSCDPVPGYSFRNGDCNDNDASVYPGATEKKDGKDNNCDGVVDNGTKPAVPGSIGVDKYCDYTKLTRGMPPSGITWYWQSSAKGTSTGNSNLSINRYSGTVYYLRARDNNTFFWSDDASSVTYSINKSTTWYADADGDGYGNPSASKSACSQPSGYIPNNTDCNDNDASVYPGATEKKDGKDNNCDGVVDNGTKPAVPGTGTIDVGKYCDYTKLTRGMPPSGITWYWQSSAKGTSTFNSNLSINRSSGTVYYLRARDNSTFFWSDDSRSVTYSINKSTTWYRDADGDGFGDPSISKSACSQPSGYVANSDDECPEVGGDFNGCPEPVPTSFSNENYVFTRTYQKPLLSPGDVSSPADVQDNITYFDGLGRPMQDIRIRAGGSAHPNIISTNSWKFGSGSAPFYNQNGSTTENNRVTGTDPFGRQELLWRCGNDAESNADGGWNTDYFPVDKNASYRYSVWVKRTGSQDGTTYHGTKNVNNLSGTSNSNPYFWYGDLPLVGQWYLIVGVIHPHSYGGGDSGISGVYDQSGNKVLSGTEYKWQSSTSTTRLRSYLYYATNTSTRQYFWQPLFQKLDGTESSISELVNMSGKADVVTHITYDSFGRKTKDYLPVSVEDGKFGAFRTGDMVTKTASYYRANFGEDFMGLTDSTANPFSEKMVEKSPLNRVNKEAAPGKDWALDNGKEIEYSYNVNTTDDDLPYLTVHFPNGTGDPRLGAYYYKRSNGTVYKRTIKNENHSEGNLNTTEEFTDRKGRLLLQRQFALEGDGIEKHDIHYVYDIYGNLTFVFPPKLDVSDGVSAEEWNNLAYKYVYDNQNRVIEKKLPGKEVEFIVYNKLGQQVMYQDGNLRSFKQWKFTKYDPLGRIAFTGLSNIDISRSSLQAEVLNNLSFVKRTVTATSFDARSVYYTNEPYPSLISNLHSVHYYDTYKNIGVIIPEVSYYGDSIVKEDKTKGLLTVEQIRVLNTPYWITSSFGYDLKGRVIWTETKNPFLGVTEVVENKLDFTGKILESKTTHSKTGQAAITTIDTYSYDHMGRLLEQKQKVDSNAEELIVRNTYDELGQLTQKQVGGASKGTGLQKVDYAYNVRGWLKKINDPGNMGDDLFGFELKYNDIADVSKKLYNGNISQTRWRTANEDKSLKDYTYTYDALNRITTGIDDNDKFSLGSATNPVSYDKNGNILNLYRKGHVVENPDLANSYGYGIMDNLTYEYDQGNKLLKVTDAANDTYGFKDGSNTGNDFSYDKNGNMLTDANKGITNIEYNHLNLPTNVAIGDGNIQYIYDATGVKQRKVAETTATDYAGNYMYKNNVLQFFNHPEGYVEYDSGSFNYVYNLTDHLGNVRLTYADSDLNGSIDPSIEILQERNYYPFGLEHKGYNGNIVTNHPYGFNGIEENEEMGLNWLDFGARNYDAALGRWMNIDPLAEEMRRFSPYTFAFNNPVYYVDPDGMMPFGLGQMDDEKNFDFSTVYGPQHITSTVVNDKGEVIDYKPDGDDNIYLNERSAENIIGTEREGITYIEGDYLTGDDLNEGAIANLPNGFLLKISADIGRTDLIFWPAEVLNIGLITWFSKIKWLMGKKLYSDKMLKAFQNQLKKDGRGSLLSSQKKIQKRLNQHLKDLKKYKKEGGYTSSVEREIKTFKAQLQAIKDVLKN